MVRDRLKSFATVSKALRASKTQRRDGQIIPHLSDLTEKPDFLTGFAVTKFKQSVVMNLFILSYSIRMQEESIHNFFYMF